MIGNFTIYKPSQLRDIIKRESCKNQAKMKKGPFTTPAETTHAKMPWAGPKRPITLTVWLGEIKKIYRENTHQHRPDDKMYVSCLKIYQWIVS